MNTYNATSVSKTNPTPTTPASSAPAAESFDIVVNLAAQAGVRYSLINPHAYTESNVTGFLNLLEGCRHGRVGHLVYASSSSVYGANTTMPYSVHQNVDHRSVLIHSPP